MLRLGDEGYGAGLPDEPLLPWLQRYAKAVGDLQRSRLTTVVVTWQRSALELHLTRSGNTEVLLSLHDTPAGLAILAGMETARVLPADDASYAPVRQFVARFERELRPVEAR